MQAVLKDAQRLLGVKTVASFKKRDAFFFVKKDASYFVASQNPIGRFSYPRSHIFLLLTRFFSVFHSFKFSVANFLWNINRRKFFLCLLVGIVLFPQIR